MLVIMKTYTFWQIYNNELEITIFSLYPISFLFMANCHDLISDLQGHWSSHSVLLNLLTKQHGNVSLLTLYSIQWKESRSFAPQSYVVYVTPLFLAAHLHSLLLELLFSCSWAVSEIPAIYKFRNFWNVKVFPVVPLGSCNIPPYLFFKIYFYSSLHSPPGIQLYAS